MHALHRSSVNHCRQGWSCCTLAHSVQMTTLHRNRFWNSPNASSTWTMHAPLFSTCHAIYRDSSRYLSNLRLLQMTWCNTVIGRFVWSSSDFQQRRSDKVSVTSKTMEDAIEYRTNWSHCCTDCTHCQPATLSVNVAAVRWTWSWHQQGHHSTAKQLHLLRHQLAVSVQLLMWLRGWLKAITVWTAENAWKMAKSASINQSTNPGFSRWSK